MVEVFGVSFWILPALVAIFGLLGGSMIGATVGFTIGFLADGLTDGPLGTACLVFMGIGYATGLYRERGDQPPALAAAIIAGGGHLRRQRGRFGLFDDPARLRRLPERRCAARICWSRPSTRSCWRGRSLSS